MGRTTVDDYLSYIPAGAEHKPSSSSKTMTPSNPWDLGNVAFSIWESFGKIVEEQRNIALNSKSEKELLPLYEKEQEGFECQNGRQVECSLQLGFFSPLQRLMTYLDCPGVFTPKPTEVILDPDYSWRSKRKKECSARSSSDTATASPIDTILIEVKTFWAFDPPDDLVPILKSGALSSQSQAEMSEMSEPPAKRSKKDDPGAIRRKVVQAVSQIYGYMSVNHLRYGVIATLEKFFFLRRSMIGEHLPMLEITKVIKRDQTRECHRFTLMEAWLSLIMKAEQDYLFTSPYSSLIVNRRIPLTKKQLELVDPVQIENLYFAEWISRNEEGQMRGARRIRGQLGVVVDGGIYGQDEEKSVMKIIDISKSPEKEAKLKHEISAYEALKSLQGEIVPKVHGALLINNWIMVLVLSHCGVEIKPEKFDARYDDIRGMLAKIHASGVAHGDITHRNILEMEEKLTIIDFSEAKLRSSSTEEEFSNDCKEDWTSLKCLLG